MESKECKITCNGKEIATIKCNENGFNAKLTKEGKKLCKETGCC